MNINLLIMEHEYDEYGDDISEEGQFSEEDAESETEAGFREDESDMQAMEESQSDSDEDEVSFLYLS